MSYSCNRGDQRKFVFTATNESGTVVEPSAVKVWVRNPSGEVTTYVYGTAPEIVKTAEKTYEFTLTFGTAGRWYIGCYSDVTYKGASEDILLIVKTSARG